MQILTWSLALAVASVHAEGGHEARTDASREDSRPPAGSVQEVVRRRLMDDLCERLAALAPGVKRARALLSQTSTANTPHNRKVLESYCATMNPVVTRLIANASNEEFRRRFAEFCPGGQPSPTLAYVPREAKLREMSSTGFSPLSLLVGDDLEAKRGRDFVWGGHLTKSERASIEAQQSAVEAVGFVDFAANNDRYADTLVTFRARYCDKDRASRPSVDELGLLADTAFRASMRAVGPVGKRDTPLFGDADQESLIQVIRSCSNLLIKI